MGRLHALFHMFKIIFPFSDFIYILQLEEYETHRYFGWLSRFYFRRGIQIRDHLRLTARAQIIYVVSVILFIILLVTTALSETPGFFRVVACLLNVISIPIHVLVANIFTSWYFAHHKSLIRKRAREKVAQHIGLKIIVIAGSYGKTTVKNYTYQLLKYAYQTQMIPGNINTSAGIADWILQNLKPSTQVLIVEADTYGRGQISDIVRMTPPDIAVLTSIGDQHLVRFRNTEELTMALNEVFESASASVAIRSLEPRIDLSKLSSASWVEDRNRTPDEINISLAIKIASMFGISESHIQEELLTLKKPDRRLKSSSIFGFQGLDDSYNISFTTACRGLELAHSEAHSRKLKLLVITAGIPELSKELKLKNRELGELLAKKADFVIILNSMFSNDLKSGIKNDLQYKIVKNLAESQKVISTWNQDEWFILLQPELTDLYY